MVGGICGNCGILSKTESITYGQGKAGRVRIPPSPPDYLLCFLTLARRVLSCTFYVPFAWASRRFPPTIALFRRDVRRYFKDERRGWARRGWCRSAVLWSRFSSLGPVTRSVIGDQRWSDPQFATDKCEKELHRKPPVSSLSAASLPCRGNGIRPGPSRAIGAEALGVTSN